MKKANTRGLELLEDARAKCIAAVDALDELNGELGGLTGSDGYDGPEYSKDAAEEDRELQREGDRLAGDRD